MSEDQSSQSEPSNINENENYNADPNAVEIPLFDDRCFIEELYEFWNICEYHEKNRARKCKKRFNELGLIARVTCDTTDEDICKLLDNGTLTFLFDCVSIQPKKLSELVNRTNSAIETHQKKNPAKHIVTGLAFEITGDGCRLGRCRNNCSIMLCTGDVITLTTDEAYKSSGYKEICHVINLKYYIKGLKLRDIVRIGNEAKGRVVKKINGNVAVYIDCPGLINSYEHIELPNQCQIRSKEDIISMYYKDLKKVINLGANYIVVPQIRCKLFLQTLRNHILTDFSFLKLIGSIDFEYVGEHKIDLWGLIKCLDYLWVRDFFKSPILLRAHICEFVIPKAKCLNKPIIGSVPLQCRNQFECIANHPFLRLIDSIFIEKSLFCCKYPFIVRKLLPISNLHFKATEKTVSIKDLPESYQSRVDFIIRSICKVNCQAIFLHISYDVAVNAVNCMENSCPLYIMLPLNSLSSDEDEFECNKDLVRTVNLRRNLHAILFTDDMNEDGYTPLEYGVDYVSKQGCVETGDFIITVELIEKEDILRLRAFFLR